MEDSYVHSSFEDGIAVARVKREKIGDFESKPLLGDLTTLAQSHGWRIAVDMTEVALLGSQGIGVFLTLHKTCNQNKGKMALCCISEEIYQMLVLSALTRLFMIKKTVAEAVAAVK
jgi:anti-anti-sigma factor